MAASSAHCIWTVSELLKRNASRVLSRMTLIAVGALLALDAQAATLRCGSQLISSGDSPFEVEQKCGTPVSRNVIASREIYNATYRRSEQVQVEEWIYGPSHGMYQYLRFVGGRLTDISSERGR